MNILQSDLALLDKDSREFIVKLFHGRCLICNGQGSDVNEIIPRSRGKASLDWKNKVFMCRLHHEEYHRKGVSPSAIKYLQEKRTKFLIAIGREEWL